MRFRIVSWAALLIVIGIATVLSWGIANAISAGEIRTVVKSGQGTLYLFSENPVGFCAAVVPHLLLAGGAWAIAYWFWATELRSGRSG